MCQYAEAVVRFFLITETVEAYIKMKFISLTNFLVQQLNSISRGGGNRQLDEALMSSTKTVATNFDISRKILLVESSFQIETWLSSTCFVRFD